MQVGNVLPEGFLVVFGDEEVIGPFVFHQKACRLRARLRTTSPCSRMVLWFLVGGGMQGLERRVKVEFADLPG